MTLTVGGGAAKLSGEKRSERERERSRAPLEFTPLAATLVTTTFLLYYVSEHRNRVASCGIAKI